MDDYPEGVQSIEEAMDAPPGSAPVDADLEDQQWQHMLHHLTWDDFWGDQGVILIPPGPRHDVAVPVRDPNETYEE